jgi:hypothetical protein
MKRLTALALCALAGAAAATYPGSVVSSFQALLSPEMYQAGGICSGGGYLWVSYFNGDLTKRVMPTGSVLSTVHLGHWTYSVAWEEAHSYVYTAGFSSYTEWWDPATGSIVGSFHVPSPITNPNGVDYNDGDPAAPIWVAENGVFYWPPGIWNLTTTGSIVRSIKTRPFGFDADAVAYDGGTPGGPYLFVGAFTAPAYIYVFNPNTGSLLSSFKAPVADYSICDMDWDGQYLWALQNGSGTPYGQFGWCFRFVAHNYPGVEPASWGKIKALFN